ncbi:hypothetical protein BDW74DRAFT_172009 [Aspergillus multicolor]|uniref:basic helix-loop-helix domain-containing protein n=1 Tax=Aspergillus multicolor TaxID=41759 RepID=UPI003CCD4085
MSSKLVSERGDCIPIGNTDSLRANHNGMFYFESWGKNYQKVKNTIVDMILSALPGDDPQVQAFRQQYAERYGRPGIIFESPSDIAAHLGVRPPADGRLVAQVIANNTNNRVKKRGRPRPLPPHVMARNLAIEKQRREALNEDFLDLARLLPDLAHARRLSKVLIVNESIRHLRRQKNMCLTAGRDMEELLAENNRFVAEVNSLRSRVYGPGAPMAAPRPVANAMAQLMSVKDEIYGEFPAGFGDNWAHNAQKSGHANSAFEYPSDGAGALLDGHNTTTNPFFDAYAWPSTLQDAQTITYAGFPPTPPSDQMEVTVPESASNLTRSTNPPLAFILDTVAPSGTEIHDDDPANIWDEILGLSTIDASYTKGSGGLNLDWSSIQLGSLP